VSFRGGCGYRKGGSNITKRGVPRMVSCFYSSSFCRRGRGSQQKRQGTWRFPTSGPMSRSRGLYKKSGPTQVRAYTLTILSPAPQQQAAVHPLFAPPYWRGDEKSDRPRVCDPYQSKKPTHGPWPQTWRKEIVQEKRWG